MQSGPDSRLPEAWTQPVPAALGLGPPEWRWIEMVSPLAAGTHGVARDHAVAAAGTLGHEALVAGRIVGKVAGDGPSARWARQCLGLDTDP